jgi:hypothetical protein
MLTDVHRLRRSLICSHSQLASNVSLPLEGLVILRPFLSGFIVALGGTTALDTFGSQAFTGGRPSDLGVHFQRCLVHLWVLFIPVYALWWWIEPVLLLLGQEPQLSKDVQTFLRILGIGAAPYIGFETVKKYLQCQGSFVLQLQSHRPANCVRRYHECNDARLMPRRSHQRPFALLLRPSHVTRPHGCSPCPFVHLLDHVHPYLRLRHALSYA